MHATTQAVREMYSAFPYPAGGPTLRQGTDARLLLSYVERSRQAGRAIHVLDAGCGRGVGLIGAASTQPDVEFLGVDLCREALRDADREVQRRGLANVRLAELDLMTLAGLEVPVGGFEVILSSGVVHHLVDPLAGLTRLADVLAPHGVLSLMVYGRHGRESLYRVVRAIDALAPRGLPLRERLKWGRELVASTDSPAFASGPWNDLRDVSEVEFVDRYLNVNETSYDVPALFTLLERAGLEFVRWTEPRDWRLDELLPAGALLERARSLSPRAQFELVDALTWRPALELVVCKRGNTARAPFAGAERDALAWNPEATLRVERRNLRGAQRTESLALQIRRREPAQLTSGPLAQAVLAVEQQQDAFALADLVEALRERGISAAAAREAAFELVRLEALYRPHLADV